MTDITLRAPKTATTPPVPDGDAVLVDGSTIHLRALVAEDRAALVSFFGGLSPESRHRRFFSTLTNIGPALLERFLDVDQNRAIAVVAERAGEIVGIGQAHRNESGHAGPDLEPSAEVAFAVLDSMQGLGIATLLLESLASQGRSVGIKHFTATTSSENTAMRGVFQAAGFVTVVERDPSDVSLVTIRFSILDDAVAAMARHHRENLATAASLQPLLKPRSIAVVGASRNPTAVGGRVFHELVSHGFTGAVVPVNPYAETLEGLAVVRSIADVPIPIDLAIVATPAEQVVGIVEQCASVGVRSVLVLSAGFSEIGGEGRERQRLLLAAVRNGGMRLVGPNCLGIVTTDPAVRMYAAFTSLEVTPGALAMMSQSGAVAIAIVSLARDMGVGFSSVVSVGNKADVSGNDLLEYWDQDTRTKVIALYLESFGNPRKFGRIARQVSRNKPILAIKAARSAAGVRAAASHTAALAADDATVDALFEQAGVLRVDEPTELLTLASALVHVPLPKGRRVAIVGNAGGLAILAADAASYENLLLATLTDDTVEALRGVAPANAAVMNPIDLTALATATQLRDATEHVLADSGVDAVIVVLISMDAPTTAAYRTALDSLVERSPKPIIAVLAASPTATPSDASGSGSKVSVPVAFSTREAALVLRRMAERSEWLARLEGPDLPIPDADLGRIRDIVQAWLIEHPEGGSLDAVTASRIMHIAGVAVNEPVLAADEDAAVDAAQKIGFPVCLKAANPNLAHRSDVGGVHLALRDDFSVAAAFRSLEHDLRNEMQGALVQAMSSPGVEMIVGLQNSTGFGPTVLVGSGGRTAELWRDTAIHLAPLSRTAASAMLASLRSFPLLNGFRGATCLDGDAVVDAIVRVAQLGDAVPELRDITINPVIVHATGVTAVDVKMTVSSEEVNGRNELRLLRNH